MPAVQLTDNEVNYAYAVAVLRQDWNNSNNAKHRYMATNVEQSLKVQKIGCVGEYALSKWLQEPWGYAPYDKDANDVAGYEVRSTLRLNGCLLTHETDKPAIYVLATLDAETRTVYLRGWQTLYETLHPTRWATHLPAPCFMTPQSLLHPMATLPAAI